MKIQHFQEGLIRLWFWYIAMEMLNMRLKLERGRKDSAAEFLHKVRTTWILLHLSCYWTVLNIKQIVEEMSDSDYEETTLSAHTLAALQEFLFEQEEQERELRDAHRLQDESKDVTITENWVFTLFFIISTSLYSPHKLWYFSKVQSLIMFRRFSLFLSRGSSHLFTLSFKSYLLTFYSC